MTRLLSLPYAESTIGQVSTDPQSTKTQQVTGKLDSDCISRQAAIETLAEYGNGRTVYIGAEEAIRRIEQLPSAQPKPITLNIDRALTQEEYEKLRKDMANAPLMLLTSAQPEQSNPCAICQEFDCTGCKFRRT